MNSENTILQSHPTIAAGVRNTSYGLASLIRIHPASLGEGIIPLPHGEFRIGRDSESDLVLGGQDVSRLHASIDYSTDERTYTICDMNSLNGTHVNDVRIDTCQLAAGDLIRMGKFIFKFLASEGVERQYHEAIYQMTISDGLTGVANKRYLLDALEREVVRSVRHSRPLSLVMLDIDHFKLTNDTYGHLAGDALLRQLCRRMETSVRRDELFARFGGEEFLVLLPEATHEEAMDFAERIRSVIAGEPFLIEGTEIPVTVSIGVATLSGSEAASPEKIVAAADAKLYEAKRAGRNRVMG